jgi:glucose/arabinose dehydrogenase
MYLKLIGFLLKAVFFLISTSTFAQTFNSDDYNLKVTTVARGLEYPWGLTFLPNDLMIVTEREGRIRIVTGQGQLRAPLKGFPKVDNGG